jgi:hypothetical protein
MAENKFENREKNGNTAFGFIILISVISSVAIIVFLSLGKQIKSVMDEDLFKLTYQFLLIVVIGGLVSLLNQLYLKQRDLDYQHQVLLRQIYTELFNAYNTTKRIRRILRAQVGIDISGNKINQNAQISKSEYKKQIDILIDAQLIFELYAKKSNESWIWFENGEKLAKACDSVEKYLNKIISEYEKKLCRFPGGDNSAMSITHLSKLAEFIGPSKKAVEFESEFKEAFQKIRLALAKTQRTK